MNKNTKIIILAVIVIIIWGGLIVLPNKNTMKKLLTKTTATKINNTQLTRTKAKKNTNDLFMVVRVIDGDTIELANDQKVRYIGINTPESIDQRRVAQCFGKEATQKNRELILNKKIKLVKDVSETDKFGRLLRYIYLDDLFINDYMVRQGYAFATTYPPDVKFAQQFREAEAEARNNQRGLWKPNVCPAPTATTP